MSSWADHCSSSDEESPALSSVLPVPETVPELSPINNVAGARKYPHNSSLSSPSSSPHRRSSNRSGGGTSPNLVLPSGPPFTAFLGGMASDVQPNELCHELEVLAGNALGTVVKCLHARIVASNRKGGQGSSVNHQHPNFAYVEMETLDDLAALMQLDDQVALQCNGNRRLKIEVANANRRQSSHRASFGGSGGENFGSDLQHPGAGAPIRRSVSEGYHAGSGKIGLPEIDGTTFRGGRYFCEGIRAGGSFREGSIDNNLTRASSTGSRDSESGTHRQRTSLKLAPRTKPMDEGSGIVKPEIATSTSQRDIFGGAKPRDESTWTKRKKEEEIKERKRVSDINALEKVTVLRRQNEGVNRKNKQIDDLAGEDRQEHRTRIGYRKELDEELPRTAGEAAVIKTESILVEAKNDQLNQGDLKKRQLFSKGRDSERRGGRKGGQRDIRETDRSDSKSKRGLRYHGSATSQDIGKGIGRGGGGHRRGGGRAGGGKGDQGRGDYRADHDRGGRQGRGFGRTSSRQEGQTDERKVDFRKSEKSNARDSGEKINTGAGEEKHNGAPGTIDTGKEAVGASHILRKEPA